MRSLFTEEQRLDSPEQLAAARARRPIDRVRLRPWDLESDRYKTWEGVDANAAVLWSWLMKGKGRKLAPAIGIVLDEDNPPPTVFRSRTGEHRVAVEVHSVRTALRRSPRGATVTDLVVEITQRRRGYFDAADTKAEGSAPDAPSRRTAGTSAIAPAARC